MKQFHKLKHFSSVIQDRNNRFSFKNLSFFPFEMLIKIMLMNQINVYDVY